MRPKHLLSAPKVPPQRGAYHQRMNLDARDLEEMYAYPAAKRPWIRTNFVATLDGAAQAANGLSGPLSDGDDKQVFDLLRSLADVILVGAGTARAENYEPIALDQIDTDLRQRLGLGRLPPIAVVSRSLNIPIALMKEGQIAITTANAPAARIAALGEQMDVIASGSSLVDWQSVIAQLAERGFHRILCEGGPTLHGTLIEADLVDELCLSISPQLAAGNATRIAHGEHATDRPMRLGHAIPAGDLVLTRYTRARR